MQILVVTAGPIPQSLQNFLPANAKVIDATSKAELDGISKLILAGIPSASDLANMEAFSSAAAELTLPILAIGAGFEAYLRSQDTQYDESAELGNGDSRLEPTEYGTKLFQGSDPIRVSQSQRWLVDEIPRSLQVLARTPSGIEAFKHKKLFAYGLQLLPDDFIYESDAKLVYTNLVEALLTA